VVGLAADRSFGDYLAGASGIPLNLLLPSPVPRGQLGAPIKNPEMTWAEVRTAALAADFLGVRYRRHLLRRYRCSGARRPNGTIQSRSRTVISA
jgi:hypothetical protein